jgi:hypothetical protein
MYARYLMNRRIFLRGSLIGACAAGLPATGFATALLRAESPVHWLKTLRFGLGLRRGSAPEASGDALASIERGFVERGYRRIADTVYYYPGSDAHFFFPLQLIRAGAGLNDFVLLALARQSDGCWQPVATLNGFQLEALCRAVAALPADEPGAADLLLPVGAAHPADGYPTRLGRVRIATRLESGGGYTSIAVYRGGDLAFGQAFPSRHSLIA